MIIFYKQYTTTLTRSTNKAVTCEHCKTPYVYEASRTAKGYGDSWFFLDNEGAKQRSFRSAERNCEKQLKRAIDLVACPKCELYQRNMIAVGKRRRLIYTALAGFPIAWCVWFWQFFIAQDPSVKNNESLPIIIWGVCICLAIAWSIWYDPNRNRQANQ